MEQKFINGVLVNTHNNTIQRYTFEYDYNEEEGNSNFLPRMYGLLDCDTIQVVERKIANKWHDIICDEEGLFKQHNIPSVITLDENDEIIEQVVGSVFVCGHDDEGEFVSMSEQEIAQVISTLTPVVNAKGETLKVLVATL